MGRCQTPSHTIYKCGCGAGCVRLQHGMLRLSFTWSESKFVYLLFERQKWSSHEMSCNIDELQHVIQVERGRFGLQWDELNTMHGRVTTVGTVQETIAGIVNLWVITAHLHSFCCENRVQSKSSLPAVARLPSDRRWLTKIFTSCPPSCSKVETSAQP